MEDISHLITRDMQAALGRMKPGCKKAIRYQRAIDRRLKEYGDAERLEAMQLELEELDNRLRRW
jgi:hypothetical protein